VIFACNALLGVLNNLILRAQAEGVLWIYFYMKFKFKVSEEQIISLNSNESKQAWSQVYINFPKIALKNPYGCYQPVVGKFKLKNVLASKIANPDMLAHLLKSEICLRSKVDFQGQFLFLHNFS
jgi:hypothetical protein